ncbi:hypothetical protein [Lacipirellula parvula]|nr:hypothetical protein [Lacipirellula parvula]
MRLDEVELVTSRWGSDAYRFHFQVQYGPDKGKEVTRQTSRSAKQGGSLIKLLSEMAGRELLPGARLSLDDFVGKDFVVQVASSAFSSGQGEYLFVQSVRPASIPVTQIQGAN